MIKRRKKLEIKAKSFKEAIVKINSVFEKSSLEEQSKLLKFIQSILGNFAKVDINTKDILDVRHIERIYDSLYINKNIDRYHYAFVALIKLMRSDENDITKLKNAKNIILFCLMLKKSDAFVIKAIKSFETTMVSVCV